MSGKLMMNGLVMYDHQTDSFWSQVTGSAISGDFSNEKLQHLAASQTTWAAWVKEYPNTLVLDKGGETMYEFDPYTSYYSDNAIGLFGESNSDERIKPKEFVVGLSLYGVAKAYPFSELSKTPVVNDQINGKSVLVTFDEDSDTALIFDREVDGITLDFEIIESIDGAVIMKDSQTNSKWQAYSGEAMEGPKVGQKLNQIPTTSLFWFAWSDFHPETEVYFSESPDKP